MQPLQQQQQQPSESHPIPESASKTPPLLKRNIEKTAEPQHAPKEMQSNQVSLSEVIAPHSLIHTIALAHRLTLP